jgi:hypothetical protein
MHPVAPCMRPCAISLLRSDKIPRTIIEWLLRQALDRHASKHLIERAKTGFGIQGAEGHRGSFHEWAKTLSKPNSSAG